MDLFRMETFQCHHCLVCYRAHAKGCLCQSVCYALITSFIFTLEMEEPFCGSHPSYVQPHVASPIITFLSANHHLSVAVARIKT